MGWSAPPWALAAAAAVAWVRTEMSVVPERLLPLPGCHHRCRRRSGSGAAAAFGPVRSWPQAASRSAMLQLLVVGYRLAWRWRLRGIPLVRPLPFLLGHLWWARRRRLLHARLARRAVSVH